MITFQPSETAMNVTIVLVGTQRAGAIVSDRKGGFLFRSIHGAKGKSFPTVADVMDNLKAA